MAPRDDVLEIRLLGGFSVQYAGEQLPPLPSRPARLLFAHLVLNAGRPQPRTLLADRFWPEVPEARARRRLSHALWQLQDALGELSPGHAYLLTPGDTVVFDAATPYWLDVEELEQRLDRVDAAGGVDGAALRELHRCVDLYRGDLLAGSYEPWVVTEQERLEQRYVTALGRLVEASKQRGNYDDALTFARRLTHQAPLREDAHREVMRLCVLLGLPSQAMEQYERCRSVLLEELGTEPAAVTTELYERIARTRDVVRPRRTPVHELVSRRLVGRDDERVTLVDQLERTLAGAPGTVFVEGEPGVGKTQLLVQVADDARWRGFCVLWGTCGASGVAYDAVREAVLPELQPVRVAQLRARLEDVWIDEAAELLPPLSQDGRAGAPARASGRLAAGERAERMRESLVQVVLGLAALDPVVLVVEDVHHADHETLALLRALAQRRHQGRLLVVMSFRDLEVREDEEVWSELRALDRDARPVRLRLRSLSAFETGGLLREVLGTPEVPAGFVGSVHRESGGNPLYALELLRALRDDGSLTDEGRDRLDTLAVPVTDGLRSLIGMRLRQLDGGTRGLVELGAVLGTEFPLDTLRAASDLDQPQLAGALGELVRRNVLETVEQTCRFTHAATRRVVLRGLDDARRRELHVRAGEALAETHPDEAEALARHFQEGDLPTRALPYLREAADRALRLHAYGTAADHLAAAAALLERVPVPVDERFGLLARLEQVLGVLGRRPEQAAVLDRLDELVGAGDLHARVEVRLRRATLLGHLDRFDEAAAVAREAVGLAGRDAPDQRGRALTALGRVLSWAGDNEGAATVLADAAALLDADPAAAVEARFALGTALRFLQRFAAARQELERALSLAEEQDDQPGIVQALGALADIHTETARTDEAVAAYERAVGLARGIGYRHREGVSLVNLGTVRQLRGEVAAAASAYGEAVAIFEDLGNRRGVATVQLNRGWLHHRWLGDDAGAQADADAARRYFDEVGNQGSAALCLETLAGVARLGGNFERARELLDQAETGAVSAGEQRAEVQVRRSLAELALATGDVDGAGDQLDAAHALARELGLVEFTAEVSSLRALALLRGGEVDAAWEQARAALAELSASAEPHRVHHRVAQVAAAAGRSEAAADHHATAYRLLVGALGGLDERAARAAVDAVPEHRGIVAAGRPLVPRELSLRMARWRAPRGRPLEREETVAVHLRLGPPSEEPAERRQQLVEVFEQVRQQDAEATIDDLATVFDVSPTTIRRDLRRLREAGHDPVTRGSGAAG